MNWQRWKLGGGVFMIAAMLAASVGPQAARAQEGGSGVGVQVVLMDQITGATFDGGSNSTYLPNFTGGLRAGQAADDITLTAAPPNNFILLQQVEVLGVYSGGTPTIDSVSVYLYADNGGAVGAFAGVATVPIGSVAGTPNFVIPTTLALPLPPAGQVRYWISVQANASNTNNRTWGWLGSSVQSTGVTASMWRNQNIDAGACSNSVWNLRVAVCAVPAPGTPQVEMALRVSGTTLNLPLRLYLPVIRK
jgi:hypothetical protein